MRVQCYSTWADPATQEQLWAVVNSKGWLCAGPVVGVNYFYIPENLVTWCLLIDPTLKHLPKDDWIV
jgi:hypothetical protein